MICPHVSLSLSGSALFQGEGTCWHKTLPPISHSLHRVLQLPADKPDTADRGTWPERATQPALTSEDSSLRQTSPSVVSVHGAPLVQVLVRLSPPYPADLEAHSESTLSCTAGQAGSVRCLMQDCPCPWHAWGCLRH